MSEHKTKLCLDLVSAEKASTASQDNSTRARMERHSVSDLRSQRIAGIEPFLAGDFEALSKHLPVTGISSGIERGL